MLRVSSECSTYLHFAVDETSWLMMTNTSCQRNVVDENSLSSTKCLSTWIGSLAHRPLTHITCTGTGLFAYTFCSVPDILFNVSWVEATVVVAQEGWCY